MTEHQRAAIRRGELKNAGLDKWDLRIDFGRGPVEACITGMGLDFPRVSDLDGERSAPFAWQTILAALTNHRPLKAS